MYVQLAMGELLENFGLSFSCGLSILDIASKPDELSKYPITGSFYVPSNAHRQHTQVAKFPSMRHINAHLTV